MPPSEKDTQRFLNHYPNPMAKSIVERFVNTPEGRSRLALSLIHPIKLARDYLKGTTKPLKDIDYPMESLVKDYQIFIAIVPPEEQDQPTYLELKPLVTELQLLIKDRKSTQSRPSQS